MQETEFSFSDMLFSALRKWRKAIVFAIVCAILVGAFAAVMRVIDMNDPEKIEEWQNEYEVAYGAYWAAINEFDRQISANERLAAQAQLEIERLNLKKAEYEEQLKDLAAQIKLYEARVKDYEASIASLKHERERLEYYLNYRKEHNANNLLMQIDPYKVDVYDTYIRVDTGYKINPDSTYQDTDPTKEILQTYLLLVNNTSFYNEMIEKLGLDTEVPYLTDVVSASVSGSNSLRIRVIGKQTENQEWVTKVGDYIADFIDKNPETKAKVVSSFKLSNENNEKNNAEHDLNRYSSTTDTIIDLGVYSKQQSYEQEVLNYETSIREVDASILNTDASIRAINADIRSLKQNIEEINLTLTNMPLDVKALEDSISSYNDDNFEFRTKQLELLKEPEPKYAGYTMMSVFTGFVKFAIIGGAVSAILAFAYFAVIGIMKGKVLSSKAISGAVNVEFFGFWSGTNKETKTNRKKAFAFVDKWIDNMSGCTVKGMAPETATELVVSNIAVACAESKKVMLCGGASKEVVDEVAEAVKAQLPGVELICGGTIGVDPVVVRGVAECDAIVLIEQLDTSALSAAVQLKERAQAMNKPVLGVVVHN